MSRIIAAGAIRGAYRFVEEAETAWQRINSSCNGSELIGFPNTAYYLPVIYGVMGHKVEQLNDMVAVLQRCRKLLPPLLADDMELNSLQPVLDAGIAALFAAEITEAIDYYENPQSYTGTETPAGDNLWLGAADDVILRKRGVEFVDGSVPGFAAILGAAPDKATATEITAELQQRNLYVFLSAGDKNQNFAQQLESTGHQLGWPTRLVPFGPGAAATVFTFGFATRVALSFGNVKPGNAKDLFAYTQERVPAFVMALGEVTDKWYALAAGALNFGFPVITDSKIPGLSAGDPPTELVVSNVPHDKIVSRSVDVRGIKTVITDVPVPVAYGPAFEGERVRGENIYLECGGGRTAMLEWVTSRPGEDIVDGKVSVIGPEITDTPPGSKLPLGIVVEVSGRQMQEDYEPILERQVHHLINYAQGVMHIGQRDMAWLRVSKDAVAKGFRLEHIGLLLHAKLHQDFGRIFEKLQVKLFTWETDVAELLHQAKAAYAARDARIEGMTDETTDIFYSCLLCQSFAPSHVCVISPERTGLCGSYNWMDCKASFEINPTGPNQPVTKGATIDARLGQWQGVNDFVFKASRGNIDHYNFYSIISDPMTACGCMECISAVVPLCNGVMTVNREHSGMTPSGMKFTTLAGTIGGGVTTPGFVGHSKYNMTQRKFLSAEGGLKRLVWMPKALKEEIADRFNERAAEIGIPDLLNRIADETVGVTEEDILEYLTENNHPALTLEPLI
ncbi:MAG: acetyl-CoA decarbonylase/synthase complex subunit alpha/beta [Dehalogenimonas sp.]|uniref:CO-methylating acetyl-CoA synthase n=1 Tax=Candidatus Dehalogenimonas loeffleri TaxID=3127115 RepID=A0ABZ2J7S9_9CHLR|nr:acetyl-CoA decarbonylase/synthase complex subunit alpha/beta [Dehalogenimonas sp.]